MTEIDIKTLEDCIEDYGNVYCKIADQYYRCCYVKWDWVEFEDSEPEPAVFFPDGTCAALWTCSTEQFVVIEALDFD